LGSLCGEIVPGRNYFVRQATTLIKFARSTKDPQLAAALIEKAADLKSQVDETSAGDEATPQAPDAQPEK
jgi:hypothetical protein